MTKGKRPPIATRILRKRPPRKLPRSPFRDVCSSSLCRIVQASGVGVASLLHVGNVYVLWAFGVDVLTCPRCGGARRLLAAIQAAIQAPDSIQRVLRAMGGCRAMCRSWRRRVLRLVVGIPRGLPGWEGCQFVGWRLAEGV
ncbi:MAG: hypothetical protein ACI91B_003374 [Planctomycetota bacterium]|jgi:hypothetical protein